MPTVTSLVPNCSIIAQYCIALLYCSYCSSLQSALPLPFHFCFTLYHVTYLLNFLKYNSNQDILVYIATPKLFTCSMMKPSKVFTTLHSHTCHVHVFTSISSSIKTGIPSLSNLSMLKC